MTDTAFYALAARIDEAFFLIGGALLAIELLNGWAKRSLRWRCLADMAASISTQVPYLLVETFVLYSAYALYWEVSAHFAVLSLPMTLWTAALAVLVADFFYYWEHRFAHEIRLLWLQHAVHHSSRHMNITTAVRFGPFEGVWPLFAMLPMVVIGFPPALVIFGAIVVLAYQTWLHTELIGKLGPLEWVFNTPSHHRVHHGCDEIYLDRNYGGILIVWDRLFGTFQQELARPRYGLKRDFDSVNPLLVWISELPIFFRDLWRAGSVREAWMRVFGPPGWRPDAS